MHIVRSDQNADTTVISFDAMIEELGNLSTDRPDAEVRTIEDASVILFSPDGEGDRQREFVLVVGELSFTVREAPYIVPTKKF